MLMLCVTFSDCPVFPISESASRDTVLNCFASSIYAVTLCRLTHFSGSLKKSFKSDSNQPLQLPLGPIFFGLGQRPALTHRQRVTLDLLPIKKQTSLVETKRSVIIFTPLK